MIQWQIAAVVLSFQMRKIRQPAKENVSISMFQETSANIPAKTKQPAAFPVCSASVECIASNRSHQYCLFHKLPVPTHVRQTAAAADSVSVHKNLEKIGKMLMFIIQKTGKMLIFICLLFKFSEKDKAFKIAWQ